MDERGKKNGYVPKDSYADKKEDARRTDAGEAADAAEREKRADGFCDNPYGDPAAEAPKPVEEPKPITHSEDKDIENQKKKAQKRVRSMFDLITFDNV